MYFDHTSITRLHRIFKKGLVFNSKRFVSFINKLNLLKFALGSLRNLRLLSVSVRVSFMKRMFLNSLVLRKDEVTSQGQFTCDVK